MREIDLLGIAVSMVGVITGLTGSCVAHGNLSRLKAFLRRRLDVNAADVSALLTEAPNTDNPAAVRDYVVALIRRYGGTTTSVAMLARLENRLAEQQTQSDALATLISAFLSKENPEWSIDCAATIAMAQQSQATFTTIFGSIPVSDLYVEQDFALRGASNLKKNTRGEITSLLPPEPAPLVIQAPFGYGKSTLLRQFATLQLDPRKLVPSSKSTLTPVPIYVPARGFLRQEGLPIWTAIEGALFELHQIRVDGFFEAHFGRCYPLIIVDGFDEIQSEERAIQLLEECLRSHHLMSGSGGFVLGGRDRFFDQPQSRDLLAGFRATQVSLIEFSEANQDEWLSKWNRIIQGGASDKSELRRLTQKDLCDSDGKRLKILTTPLILFLHAALRSNDTEPVTVATVFERLVDATVAGKAVIAGGPLSGFVDILSGSSKNPLDKQASREILEDAAYIALRNGERTVYETELRDLAENDAAAGSIGSDATKSKLLGSLAEMVYVAHFFEQRETGVQFLHQSFVEYLSATRYVRTRDDSMIPLLTPVIESFIREIANATAPCEMTELCREIWAQLDETWEVEESDARPDAWYQRIRFVLRHCHPRDVDRVLDWVLERGKTRSEYETWDELGGEELEEAVCWKGRVIESLSLSRRFGQGLSRFKEVSLLRPKLSSGDPAGEATELEFLACIIHECQLRSLGETANRRGRDARRRVAPAQRPAEWFGADSGGLLAL